METQNVQQEEAESDTVTYLRRGMISILDVIAVKLPDVFTAEILPKLDLRDTLRLAQVNKAYNAAVWSVDGVRSMEAKIEAHLVKTGGACITEPLYWAASYGNVPAVRACLESGVDVNKSFTSHVLPSIIEYTALHAAVQHGQVAVMKALIEAGADVNKATGDNATALTIAALRGHTHVVMELIKAGADVNLEPYANFNPIYAAACNGHESCVALLIQAGADVRKAINHSRAWIAMAKSYNQKSHEHESIVKLLKQFRA
jgi:hypothetical protein